MVETAGTKLRRARQLRQLSIEDASRATKIRVRQLADLEADDYSNFANLAYAKSFLIAYGKYLAVDTRAYMDAFADANTFGMDDYQYLSDQPVGVYRSTRRMPRSRTPKRKQFVMAGATVGVLAILLFGWLAYNTVQRLGDLDKIAARREARAHAGQGDKSVSTAPDALPANAPESTPGTMPVSATPLPGNTPASIELPALASSVAAPVSLTAVSPTVPLPGDGAAVRKLMGPSVAQKSALDPVPSGDRAAAALPLPLVFRVDEPQPQKVVNNAPRLPVN